MRVQPTGAVQKGDERVPKKFPAAPGSFRTSPSTLSVFGKGKRIKRSYSHARRKPTSLTRAAGPLQRRYDARTPRGKQSQEPPCSTLLASVPSVHSPHIAEHVVKPPSIRPFLIDWMLVPFSQNPFAILTSFAGCSSLSPLNRLGFVPEVEGQFALPGKVVGPDEGDGDEVN